MSNNEVLEKLKAIEKNQSKSSDQSAIAFGVSVIVISWNFINAFYLAGRTDLTVASYVLFACGLFILCWPGLRRLKTLHKPKQN